MSTKTISYATSNSSKSLLPPFAYSHVHWRQFCFLYLWKIFRYLLHIRSDLHYRPCLKRRASKRSSRCSPRFPLLKFKRTRHTSSLTHQHPAVVGKWQLLSVGRSDAVRFGNVGCFVTHIFVFEKLAISSSLVLSNETWPSKTPKVALLRNYFSTGDLDFLETYKSGPDVRKTSGGFCYLLKNEMPRYCITFYIVAQHREYRKTL